MDKQLNRWAVFLLASLSAGAQVLSPIISSGNGYTPSVYYRSGVGLFQSDACTTAASANNDPVGCWQDQNGLKNLVQATGGNKPLLSTATPVSVSFDGSSDNLKYAAGISDTIGSITIAFQTGATAFSAAQALFSSADEGSANNWFEVGISADGRIYIESNASGTKHTVVGSTYLYNSTNYFLVIAYDGTDYFALLNGVEQNPLIVTSIGPYAWFGNVSGADNLVMGGTVTSAGLVRPCQAKIMEVAIYSQDITQ